MIKLIKYPYGFAIPLILIGYGISLISNRNILSWISGLLEGFGIMMIYIYQSRKDKDDTSNT